MFTITGEDIRAVLHDYGIQDEYLSFSELERYHYEQEDPESRQVRVIVKVNLQDGRALVVRFKNEEDAPQHVIEEQSRFAVLLYESTQIDAFFESKPKIDAFLKIDANVQRQEYKMVS